MVDPGLVEEEGSEVQPDHLHFVKQEQMVKGLEHLPELPLLRKMVLL